MVLTLVVLSILKCQALITVQRTCDPKKSLFRLCLHVMLWSHCHC